MNKTEIRLTTEHDLRIFMMPMRQKIIRVLKISPTPLTAKNISDQLGISASSVQHHIKQLEAIGLVEHDHYEIINGIRANYFKAVNVTVRIGQENSDEFSGNRDVVVQNLISQVYDGYTEVLHAMSGNSVKNNIYGDFLSGVIHLNDDDAAALLKLIFKFIIEHEQTTENTTPWEYEMILYKVGAGIKTETGSTVK